MKFRHILLICLLIPNFAFATNNQFITEVKAPNAPYKYLATVIFKFNPCLTKVQYGTGGPWSSQLNITTNEPQCKNLSVLVAHIFTEPNGETSYLFTPQWLKPSCNSLKVREGQKLILQVIKQGKKDYYLTCHSQY